MHEKASERESEKEKEREGGRVRKSVWVREKECLGETPTQRVCG